MVRHFCLKTGQICPKVNPASRRFHRGNAVLLLSARSSPVPHFGLPSSTAVIPSGIADAATEPVDMGMREWLYLIIAALASTLFYLRGLDHGEARAKAKARRKLHVPFNDSGCLTELPNEPFEEVLRELKGERPAPEPALTQAEIRAVFGDN